MKKKHPQSRDGTDAFWKFMDEHMVGLRPWPKRKPRPIHGIAKNGSSKKRRK